MPTEVEEVDGIIAEAKTDYDLIDRLRKRGMRTATIKLYTDEITGDLLGTAHDEPVNNILGIPVSSKRVREGVLGEIDELESVINPNDGQKKRLKALHAEAKKLRATLEATSIIFKLRAVPQIIVDSVRRETKQALKIKGKNIPEDREEEFIQKNNALLLSKIIESFTDTEAGITQNGISVEWAEGLKEYLPPYEYVRLNVKLNEIQFKNALSEGVTDQADF